MLSMFKKLVRLDLSGNRIQNMEVLSNCKSLKWLSVSDNCLTSLQGIEGLSNLTVLNCSRNKLTSMDGIRSLLQIRALILNDNQIPSICQLEHLSNLNTLVLSRNPIRIVGAALSKVSSLAKFSLSNCQVQDVGILKHCTMLKELRLAHNQLPSLPIGLEENIGLHILDVGNNNLRKWSDVEVLSMLPHLENLNLRGNPVCSQSNYEAEVRRLLPQLQILDGHLLEGATKKQKTNLNLVLAGASKEENTREMDAAIPTKKSKQVKMKKKAETRDKHLNRNEISRKKASMDNEIRISDEQKPFLEPVLSVKSNTSTFKETDERTFTSTHARTHHYPEESDSGVISVADRKKFKFTASSSKQCTRRMGSVFLVSLEESNIGAGGPSSWDL